jgi:Cu/Ag efflux protein CusF
MRLRPARTALTTIAIGLIASAAPLALHAQATTTMTRDTAPGKAVATETTKATATVAAVDAAGRGLTLKMADGRTMDLVAGPEVKNFDQIKPGDKVRAEYVRALSLELKKGSAASAAATGKAGMVRAPEGSKPAMAAAATVNVTADVVAVNHKDKLVTLRGPKGNLVDLRVDDPAQLANIKTGDKVDAVYSEALAVKVDAAPK